MAERAAHPPPPPQPAQEGDRQHLRLWLRLLRCTNQIEREVRARLRRDFATTLPRFDMMAALDRAGDEGLTMGALSERLMVSNGNVTGVAARLEREGLVRRWSPPDDRRRAILTLTEAGTTRFAEMAVRHKAWIDELLGTIEADELATISNTLSRTSKHIAQTGGDSQ